MKKNLLLVFTLLICSAVVAGPTVGLRTNNVQFGLKKKFGMLGGGPYILFGIGYPKGQIKQLEPPNYTDDSKLGVQYSGEIGYQHMFFKSKSRKLGLGLNVSFFTLGKSSYSPPDNPSDSYIIRSYGFFRIGPTATWAFHKNMAVDIFFNLMPTLQKGTRISTTYDASTGITTTTVVKATGLGGLIIPGIRFRYSIISVGFEYQYASIKMPISVDYKVDTPVGPISGVYNGKAINKLFMPRITFGVAL
jgi:hypothetical protein